MKNSVFINLFAATALSILPLDAIQMGGYFENWAQYRGIEPSGANRGTFPSCTPQGFSTIAKNLNILNYAFLAFNIDLTAGGDYVATGDWKVYASEWNDVTSYGDGGLLAQAAELKQFNNNLKIMLSIGGWNFVSPSSYGAVTAPFFNELFNSSINTEAFIASLTDPQTGWFFKKSPDNSYYLVDGIDIDYEYPGQSYLGGSGSINNPGATNDYQGFIEFIQALRVAINTINASNVRPHLYISLTVPPFLPGTVVAGTSSAGTYSPGSQKTGSYPEVTINPSDPSTYFAWYSIVANHCDWVNLMTYDMYGAGFSNGFAMYQAPLYNGYNGSGNTYNPKAIPLNTEDQAYSVDYAVYMWTQGAEEGVSPSSDQVGVSPAMIQLGIPSYGRSYGSNTTVFNSNPILQSYSPGNTGGFSQPYTQQSGVAAYFEIVSLLGSVNRNISLSHPTASAGNSTDMAQTYFVANATKNQPTNNVFVYDSPSNVQAKVNYAIQENLGGIFFYALSEDNFDFGSTATSGYGFKNTLFYNALQQVRQPGANTNGKDQSTSTPN